ncbi:MAG: hypothetical protein PVG83_03050 [Acidimicrobiia bacterium]
MTAHRKIVVVGLAVALATVIPLAALADDGARGDEARGSSPATVEVDADPEVKADKRVTTQKTRTDRNLTDQRISDRRVSDRSDRVLPTDERPVRRCARLADNPRRCVDDHPTDIDYRHLLWRLFKAHEWEKLIRLLEHLGLI